MRDRDGAVFVSYLKQDFLKEHFELLNSYEPDQVSASVLEKLHWLADYHNHIAKQAKSELLFGGPLVMTFEVL